MTFGHTFQRFMYDRTIHLREDGQYYLRVRYGLDWYERAFKTMGEAQVEYNKLPRASGEYPDTQDLLEIAQCR